MRVSLALACATVAAAMLGGSAVGRPAVGRSASADPGVSATTILLGGAAPLSGPASAYASVARGAEAYFAYVNARGGVHGRTIRYRYLDDAYNPAQSVQVTKQLVEQDRVFAIFNSLGTAQNEAVRPYLNQAGVPQLFVASGATTFGRDYKRYPLTIGFQPSYQAEGRIYGAYLARTKPGATVAVLYQADDYGKDLLRGLRRGIARSKVRIVATEAYGVTDADVQSQVATMKASGASTLALFATPKFSTQAYLFAVRLGWRPLVLVNAVSSASNVMATAAAQAGAAVEGSISLVYYKDPLDPRSRSDPGMRLYRSILARHGKGANANDVYHVYGMAVAYETVRILKALGRNPTRASLVAQLSKLSDASNPFLLPGIQVKTGMNDRFPIEQALLQRWSRGGWKRFGGLWGLRTG